MNTVIDINKERSKRGLTNARAVREVSTVIETEGGLFIFFTDGKCNFMEARGNDVKTEINQD